MARDWKPVNDTVRFPSMIARNLFGYSVGYLLGGNEADLNMAKQLKTYLLRYAWDEQYGGWYDALSPEGKPSRTTKSTFVQLYVNTGLTLYYVVTKDSTVRSFIDRSNDLLETNAWDHEHDGYFDQLQRDWSVGSEVKTISSQLAPASGYLLYLYLATREDKYIKQAERIMGTILDKMVDPQTGWVLETFDRSLNYQPGKDDETEINIGHNIEVAWTLLRLYIITRNEAYLTAAKSLADRIHQYGFNPSTGIWYANIGNQQPQLHTGYTHWWIQAYGNMFDLYLAQIFPEGEYLASFRQGATFWDSYIMDKQYGDSFLTVTETGEVTDDRKANQFKASYHNMEHCMLNALYLANWINREPVTLHFSIVNSHQGELLFPIPIETLDTEVAAVRINDQPYANREAPMGVVILPSLKEAHIEVTIQPQR